jgi:DNA-directed RNA polymerase subunit RPC12/RpoP
MNRNIATPKLKFETDNSGSKCGICEEEFENPLLAMVLADSLVEEYYACPKCLSKVVGFHQKDVMVNYVDDNETEIGFVASKFGAAVEDSASDVEGCVHHLGYLKKRLKNSDIPEECLTCSKMIECMY